MSLLKTNNVQIGQSVTATNNFTWYQPSSPDGTVRLGNGNSGSVTDLVTLTSAGNLGIGTSSPSTKLTVYDATTPQVTFNNGTSTFIVGLNSGGNNKILYGTGAYPMIFYTNATEQMRLDASGNLGLGVTPSGWSSSWKAFQFGSVGVAFSNSSNAIWSGNEYLNSGGTPTYLTSQYALRYRQDVGSGYHAWFTSASGTAGNAISFTQAMTLDASGNLLVGTTSASGSTTNLTQTVGGIHSSLSGSGGSFTSGVAGTLFTMANINNGQTWLVTVTLDGEGIISYNCTYVVVGEGANAAVAQLYKGPNASISVSGLAVQYTQSSGGTKTNVRWSAIRIL